MNIHEKELCVKLVIYKKSYFEVSADYHITVGMPVTPYHCDRYLYTLNKHYLYIQTKCTYSEQICMVLSHGMPSAACFGLGSHHKRESNTREKRI